MTRILIHSFIEGVSGSFYKLVQGHKKTVICDRKSFRSHPYTKIMPRPILSRSCVSCIYLCKLTVKGSSTVMILQVNTSKRSNSWHRPSIYGTTAAFDLSHAVVRLIRADSQNVCARPPHRARAGCRQVTDVERRWAVCEIEAQRLPLHNMS